MPADLYPDAPAPIRDDIVAERQRVWAHIAGPGSWFTGAERLATAAETRRARDRGLCQARKDALSPNAVDGDHSHAGVPREGAKAEISADFREEIGLNAFAEGRR